MYVSISKISQPKILLYKNQVFSYQRIHDYGTVFVVNNLLESAAKLLQKEDKKMFLSCNQEDKEAFASSSTTLDVFPVHYLITISFASQLFPINFTVSATTTNPHF